MRFLKLCSFLLLFLLAPFAVHAQQQAWEVVLFAPTLRGETLAGGTIVFVTPSGISQQYAIPSNLIPAGGGGFPQISVSPDRQRAAIAFPTQGQGAPPITIVGLGNNSAVTVTLPDPQIEGYSLAGFSPDSSQLAFAYVSMLDAQALTTGGGIAVADAATGSIVAQAAWDAVSAATTGENFIRFAQMGSWREDGVYFVPSCYACEGTAESPYYVWDPATDQIATPLSDAYFSFFGDTLPLTGEMLYTVENKGFPASGNAGYFPPANVVEYYADGVPAIPLYNRDSLSPDADVVYFNPQNLDLYTARWVLDGNGFVIQGDDNFADGVLVLRNGTQQSIPLALSDRFLAGTPDGWLAQDANFNLNHYTLVNGVVTVTPLGQLAAEARTIDSTPLGATAMGVFPTVNPPVPQAALPAACAGFLPSRLTAGGTGRVTPGDANNLRSEPNTGGQIIGVIPGASAFTVLEGPVCDPAGIAWWRVDFNGIVGWTAEGQGNTYFVEPV